MDNQTLRERLKDKKKIVVKVGSSSLTHAETGSIDLIKMEKLVRELTDLHNRGKEVILVSSGAIAVGRKTIGMKDRPSQLSVKQACASIGQARLMMMYQKFFMEYNQIASRSDDQEYAGEWREQDQCSEYLRYIAPYGSHSYCK